MHPRLLACLVAAAAAAASRPVNHLAPPAPLWNQAIQSPPGVGNAVQISPDDRWLYVTSADGTLSKLDPPAGEFHDVYRPPPRGPGWYMYGTGGVAIHVADKGAGTSDDGVAPGSYLVFWVLDVSPTTPPVASSRVIAVVHDDALTLDVLWIKDVPGIIEGTPVIGSDGQLIYFTMNSTPGPSIPPPTLPPTPPPTEPPSRAPTEALTTANATAPSDGSGPFSRTPGSPPTPVDPGRQRARRDPAPEPDGRRLQAQTSGRFLVLSHPRDGQVLYDFDSRDALSVQQHRFASAAIARRPRRGNYNGGAGNTRDVLLWGSLPDAAGASRGETLLFQLPGDFDAAAEAADAGGFRTRVLESVAWTTRTRPALTADGMAAYFAITGNRFTGWNKGQSFDVVPNLGPIQLPPGDSDSLVAAGRPVLADDDKLLLVTSSTRDALFAIDSVSGEISWTLDDLGDTFTITTPQTSADDTVAYFGKQNSVHAVALSDGSRLWGANGYETLGGAAARAMEAELSLSSTGEFLYYNSAGSTISALRIAWVVPTASPVAAPSGAPSSVASEAPSASVVPSLPPSARPSRSAPPSLGPDKTSSPTATVHPSVSPSADQSGSPSDATSNVPSLPSTEGAVLLTPPTASPLAPSTPPTASPLVEAVAAEAPTSNPVASSVFPADANPPSASAERTPDNSNDDGSSSTLTMTAIIGIAAGGGVGLLLLIGGIIWFIRRKKENSEDDGVDTDWQQSSTGTENKSNAEEGKGAAFQYGSSSNDSPQQSGQQSGLDW